MEKPRAEPHEIRVSQNELHRNIYVTNLACNYSYEGAMVKVLNDVQNLDQNIQGGTGFAEQATDRIVECTLHLTPYALKRWAVALTEMLNDYEATFGSILTAEEIDQKILDASAKVDHRISDAAAEEYR